ncbi:hypothetical protein F2P81_017099 [Scophthalmus maximus]|uniref:Uncharacterized protein n=1 Tax=Scophthalmus maximus TaxID=52904 RepID=A0A6A4SDN8_SCOMX|nr:hypothetical protein F2P81_017099 [Scophthalmus maximus]
MVAEMACCGAACQLEDGDGDIPTPENKETEEADAEESQNGERLRETASRLQNITKQLLCFLKLFVVYVYTDTSARCHSCRDISGNSLDHSHNRILMAATLHN